MSWKGYCNDEHNAPLPGTGTGMRLRRVARACTTRTFSSVFADAVGAEASMSRIAKAVVYLPPASSSAVDEVRATIVALGHAGASEVVGLEPLQHPEEILVAVLLADAATAMSIPAPDVTVAHTADYDVAWFGNAGRSAEYEGVFARTQEKLRAAGLSVAHLWKTWSYLPVDATSGRADEAFVDFNRRRATWFEGVGFGIEAAAPDAPFAFPANTGVGDLAGCFSLSGIAGRVRDDATRVVEIDNPNQQAPRQYGTGQSGRRAPAHFSRAVGVLGRKERWILVAGTASVVGSSTANIDAVSSQATQTLANLSTLAAEAMRKQGADVRAVPISEAYENLVVYLTQAEHLDAVRQTVDAVARDIPVTYLRCPLTRTDLLVEMEGELA
jgi:enamine deaminase RidA (YjgF/YER057c/UK114 family)